MIEFIATHIGALLLGAGGLTGIAAVVMIFVFGIPAAAIVASALSLGGKIVDFLKTPVGQAVAVVALCALCLFVGDVGATRREVAAANKRVAARDLYWKNEIDAAEKAFATKRKERDASIDTEVKGLVAQRLSELADLTNTFKVKPDANDPANCVLRPSDLDDGVRTLSRRSRAAAAH